MRSAAISAFDMIDTDAVEEVQQMVSVGSKPILIALTEVVGVLVALLVVLLIAVATDQMRLFDLQNVVTTLQPH